MLSIFVRSTAVVVVAFIIAVGFFVFNTIAVKKADYNEKQKAEEEIAVERSRVETEIADYTKDYTEKKRKALDNKLSSLRLRPASSDEL